MFDAGVSTFGNTLGTTGTTDSQLLLVGGNNVTLSQSIDGVGATVTISAADQTIPTVNFYQPFDHLDQNGVNTRSANLPMIQPVNPESGFIFPGNMTIGTFDAVVSFSTQANQSNANTVSYWVGLYTNNNSTLSLQNSAMSSFSQSANASNSQSFEDVRHFTIHSSVWSAQPVLTQGEYWIAQMWATAGGGPLFGYFQHQYETVSSVFHGTAGQASTTNPSAGAIPFSGVYSTTTNALPTALQISDVVKSPAIATQYAYFQFNNEWSTF